MLDIATVVPASGPADPTKISLSIDKIVPIQVREPSSSKGLQPEALPTNPPPATPPAPTATPGIQRRLYEDSPSINRGLFFVPR